MKREWYRDGQIDRGGQVRKRDLHAVDEAARALEESPDSRDRHRVLARALSRVGNLERARGVVESWIERDALDPEALTYLSDVLGREGKRDEALRLLTGIVDLQPDNRLLQSRLARAFERANMLALACAHRQTLAELDAEDAESLAGAIRCLRQLERTAEADALRASITDDKLRTKVAALTEKPTTSDARGDLLLSADWKADVDLDLSLVTLQGTRISWMGGRVNVVGKDASSHGKETLGLKRGSAGRYSIEVARTDPKDTRQVSGTIRVKAMEEVKTLRFSVSGPRAEVGRVTVRRKSRLIPTSAPVRAR